MDALALTPCYSVFLTTADVPEVYMHQFWDSIHKYDTSYKFRMDKKKKFDLNLEIFRGIFHIYPRVHGQNFDEPPTDEVIMSFFKELGHTGKSSQSSMLLLIRCINHRELLLLSSIEVYLERQLEDFTYQINNRGYKKQEKMYYPRFTKVSIRYFLTKDKTVSRRNKIRDDYLINTLRFVSAKEESQIYRARLPVSMTSPEIIYEEVKESSRKLKRVERPAKKSTNATKTGVVIRDTLVMSLSKKKEKITVEKRKGIDFLSEVALTEEAQYEEVRKKSLRDFHKTHPSGSGIVTSVTKIKPSVTNKGTSAKPGVPDMTEEESTESEAKPWGRDEDDKKWSDSEHETDENETGSESNQEENEEEVEVDEDDEEENYTSTDDEDETNVESKGTDAEMINVQQGNENLEITLNQVIKDAHATISTATKKTEVPVTSSSHSSDLASKFLNFSDIPYTDAEIVSPMDVHVHHEEVSNFAPHVIKRMVTESLEHAVLAKESSQPKSTYEAAASLTKFELKKILIDKMDENRGLKKRKTSKDVEPTKGPKNKESKFGSSKGTKSQSKSSRKSIQAEEPEFEVADFDMPQYQEENLGNDDEPKGKVASKHDWFTKPKQPQEPNDSNWNVGKTPQKRTNSKLTKAAQYDLPGIKDMVPNIWSLVKFAYDKHAIWGISHWIDQLTRVENKLTNLSGNDVSDFAIALRMFTRSMVIQKRVKDLQMGVESYQKKINVTKPETTRPGIRKRDPYTPYQDPQGFIYVDNKGRNRLMRSDELYKFSDGTLTGL
ncbi:hypothetical protein Tco_1095818 [Tanacetum coccineum]